jgi:hypothetical protein
LQPRSVHVICQLLINSGWHSNILRSSEVGSSNLEVEKVETARFTCTIDFFLIISLLAKPYTLEGFEPGTSDLQAKAVTTAQGACSNTGKGINDAIT